MNGKKGPQTRHRTSTIASRKKAGPKTPLGWHATHAGAVAAAQRCGAPNTIADSERDAATGLYRPVLVLRDDQVWMREHVEERGVKCVLASEWTLEGPR